MTVKSFHWLGNKDVHVPENSSQTIRISITSLKENKPGLVRILRQKILCGLQVKTNIVRDEAQKIDICQIHKNLCLAWLFQVQVYPCTGNRALCACTYLLCKGVHYYIFHLNLFYSWYSLVDSLKIIIQRLNSNAYPFYLHFCPSFEL